MYYISDGSQGNASVQRTPSDALITASTLQVRKPSLTQSPSVPTLATSPPTITNGARRPSPNILLPTNSSPLPGSAPAKRRLSVPLPQENIFSRSSDASSNASSSSRRPSYVSALLAGSGKTFQKLKTRFNCNIWMYFVIQSIVYISM